MTRFKSKIVVYNLTRSRETRYIFGLLLQVIYRSLLLEIKKKSDCPCENGTTIILIINNMNVNEGLKINQIRLRCFRSYCVIYAVQEANFRIIIAKTRLNLYYNFKLLLLRIIIAHFAFLCVFIASFVSIFYIRWEFSCLNSSNDFLREMYGRFNF